MAQSTGKKGGKKIGRQKRKPAHLRYNAEDRYNKNKKRRMRKQKKFEEKKRLKKENNAA